MIKCLKPISKENIEKILEQINYYFYKIEDEEEEEAEEKEKEEEKEEEEEKEKEEKKEKAEEKEEEKEEEEEAEEKEEKKEKEEEEGGNKICFLSHVKFKNKNIPVIITKYQIINETNLSKNKNIRLKINNDFKIIEFGETIYLNESQNLSVIEIKSDKDNELKFLELDDYLYEKESEMYYDKESIYIINYNNKNNASISYGILDDIDDSEITYLSNLNINNELMQIFKVSNNKMIGLHIDNSKNRDTGLFFKFIINEFINEYNKKQTIIENMKNEINILFEIDKKNINKDIFFLNNNKYFEFSSFKLLYFNEHKIELNDSNTELYINDIKYKYKKYFRPKQEG